HYFLEFDIYDKITNEFFSTERRRIFLEKLPFVVSVKVLYEGPANALQTLTSLINQSHFISDGHLDRLRTICKNKNLDPAHTLKETDPSTLMEGLYIKVEDEGLVKARYKYVRTNFLQTIASSESHWLDRPLLSNQLKEG